MTKLKNSALLDDYMAWLIGILIIGFLIYAAGRETRFGGLGFLWRSAVVLAGIAIVGVIGLFFYEKYQSAKWREQVAFEEATKTRIQEPENSFKPKLGKPVAETAYERRIRLGLPIPFETVLSREFPATSSQVTYTEDGEDAGTVGWKMDVAEIPNVTPSTRKTGFFMNLEQAVVKLDGSFKLVCQNTAPKFQKTLVGCRPVIEGEDGLLYETMEGDWKWKKYPIGTKVEFYVILPCTKDLINAKEPCQI